MKKFIAFVLFVGIFVMGCSNTVESDSQSIYGSWVYESSDGVGLGVTFNTNGTYAAVLVGLTSDTTANAEIEIGNFAANNNMLTMTTKQSSCSDASKEPETMPFNIDGDSLGVAFPKGMLFFHRNNASSANNGIITYGCVVDGKFVPSPIQTL